MDAEQIDHSHKENELGFVASCIDTDSTRSEHYLLKRRTSCHIDFI